MDKEIIRRFQNTRLRLVQEEYALLMGEPNFEFSDIEIDIERYNAVKQILNQSREYIDGLVTKYSPERGPELLPKPVLAILRVVIAEAFIGRFVPPKVGINEAVELAKKFGTARSYSFVNGVLASILKNDFPDLYEQAVRDSETSEDNPYKGDAKGSEANDVRGTSQEIEGIKS